ncbi:MAG: glycoside hydrolase family 172 protein [Chloroflexota bacterium]
MSEWKNTPLGNLPRIRNVKTKRVSSWDKSGGNDDFIIVNPGETAVLADIVGAGVINHFWCTMGTYQVDYLRRIVLRMRWDNEEDYSVEVPIGDFFGVGHAMKVPFSSMPLQMAPEDGKGFNCFFTMPYAERALVELTNECDVSIMFYYYVDYEIHDSIPEDMGRFHAQWHRQNPTDGVSDEGLTTHEWLHGGKNLDGKGNYIILDAEGQGVYVGCNLNIHNLHPEHDIWPNRVPWPLRLEDMNDWNAALPKAYSWFGEGDDMIFIDGETWPPTMHGTGLEDYFNAAWCPNETYDSLYHGITVVPEGPGWAGKISLYRFHVEDPIHFEKSIKVTIEHGHDNRRSDDYSSTAYWYQLEPHKAFPTLPSVSERLPVKFPK